MGMLDGLFGRSRDRKAIAKDRCMECGMEGSAHTDWCPAGEDRAAPAVEITPPADEAPGPEAPPRA